MRYTLKCKYKEQVFIPCVAISSNIQFLWKDTGERECLTADNVKCIATEIKEINILSDEATELVKKLYNIDVWEYLKKWYKFDKHISSLDFIKMNLKKE